MPVTIVDVQQGTEEWQKEREGFVTGSVADVLLVKGLDTALRENFKRFKGNYYTQRGHILEDEAIELFEAIHDEGVDRPGIVVNTEFENAKCSPDGIYQEKGTGKTFLLEVKCFALKRHSEIKKLKDIPYKIMAQLQFNMMICELNHSILVMYNPDCENEADCYREIIVKADKTIQDNFKQKLGVA